MIIRLLVLYAMSMFAQSVWAQTACDAQDGLNFVCGATNPEDLVLVPGTSSIIASSMADGAAFYLVDTQTDTLSMLPFQTQHDPQTYPLCSQPPSPASLNTHGLSIRDLGPGKAQLHVVGHGGREAIEVFAIDSTAKPLALTWTGCVAMPEGLEANSVATFADGTILATVLFMPGTTFSDAIVERRNTGAVYEWAPGDPGFTLVQGSELPANNGIETSLDGQEFYVASSGLQTIVAFSHSNPARRLRSTPPLAFTPDNVHLGVDGRLYTAGMANDVPECGGAPGAQHDIATLSVCPRGTIAVVIEPSTMAPAAILTTAAISQFSNATMVLPIADQLWIGSFSSDRIARSHNQEP